MIPVVSLDKLYKNIGAINPNAIFSGSFNLIRVENILDNITEPIRYTRRTYYKISLVIGKSRIEYPDKKFDLNGETLVFTNPILPYKWVKEVQQQTGYVAIFTLDFLNRFGSVQDFSFFKNHHQSVIGLDENQAKLFRDVFIRMEDELEGSYVQKYEVLALMMMELVHYANKIIGGKGNPSTVVNPYEKIASAFIDKLERDFLAPQLNHRIHSASPSEYATAIGIHVNNLNKVLRELTGQTTTALISQRFMQEAKHLLATTSYSIKEISWLLGFEEPNHFSSFFKNQSGLSPKEFRKISSI